jgi:hypothetical protein
MTIVGRLLIVAGILTAFLSPAFEECPCICAVPPYTLYLPMLVDIGHSFGITVAQMNDANGLAISRQMRIGPGGIFIGISLNHPKVNETGAPYHSSIKIYLTHTATMSR